MNVSSLVDISTFPIVSGMLTKYPEKHQELLSLYDQTAKWYSEYDTFMNETKEVEGMAFHLEDELAMELPHTLVTTDLEEFKQKSAALDAWHHRLEQQELNWLEWWYDHRAELQLITCSTWIDIQGIVERRIAALKSIH
jgi:hypothetical protein